MENELERERDVDEGMRDVKGLAPRGTIRGRSERGARNSPIVAEASKPTIAP
jgi:hypothetical protein